MLVWTPVVADDPPPGTHTLEGPVKVLWEARYDESTSVSGPAYSLALSPDSGTVFVTGPSATIAYKAATGDEIWIAAVGGYRIAVSG
jgi:hypothetical protein